MNSQSEASSLYLYIQGYRVACQHGDSLSRDMHEYFYASDDDAAGKLAQELLAMKNERAVLPYVETSLERSTQDAHVCYYLFPAVKQWQSNGTYYAKPSLSTKRKKGVDVRSDDQ